MLYEQRNHVRGKRMKYGYIRVSTRDQNEDRQVMAMEEEDLDEIFIDKQSGKDFVRPGYHRMKSVLEEGDVICIKSIDRLGRNYLEIQKEWRELVHDMKVDIYVLDMPLLDTRKGKDLMGTFVADLVLQILSFVAENERSAIRGRQADGIKAAQRRGVKFGRPRIVLNDDFYKQARLWKRGKVSCRQAASNCGMPTTTFFNKAKQVKIIKKNS